MASSLFAFEFKNRNIGGQKKGRNEKRNLCGIVKWIKI